MSEDEKPKKKLLLWLRVLLISLDFYVVGIIILIFTHNVILFPTVVLLGSFMIPLAYVAFFYERRDVAKVNPYSIINGFVYGGLIGVFMAAVFEPIFIKRLDLLTAFGAGLIEEFVKIFGLFLIMRKNKHTSQLNGIVIGAVVGMGFAAFESTGYAFDAFLGSGGSLTDTVFVTLLRGILSPLGHSTWTAILAGILFRESSPIRFKITKQVIKAYLTVSILHGLWDGLPSIIVKYVLPGIDFFLAEGFIALIGVVVLIRSWRGAKKRELALS